MVVEAMQVPNLLHLLSSRPCSLGIHKPATLVSVVVVVVVVVVVAVVVVVVHLLSSRLCSLGIHKATLVSVASHFFLSSPSSSSISQLLSAACLPRPAVEV